LPGPVVDAGGRCLGDGRERGVWTDLIPGPVEPVHQRRARGTGIVPVRTEHEGVQQQGALVPEQLGELHLGADLPLAGPLEDVVLLQLAAGRERAAACRHGLHFVDQLLLVLEQGVASLAIRHAFIGISQFTHVSLLVSPANASSVECGLCLKWIRPRTTTSRAQPSRPAAVVARRAVPHTRRYGTRPARRTDRRFPAGPPARGRRTPARRTPGPVASCPRR
jgi:hypothetical protein